MEDMIVLMAVFGLFIGNSVLVTIPELKGHHAYIGNYPNLNMARCGFINPKDVPKGRAPKTRIINGALAKLGEFPWQVTIFHKFRKDGNHLCDGVLIHKYWVLTVKHCVTRKRPDDAVIVPKALKLSFGTIDARVFYEVRNITQIVNHPYPEIDLSLLRLEKPIDPTQSADGSYYLINQICLPVENALNVVEEQAIMSGFGNSDYVLPPPAPTTKPLNKLLRKTLITIDSVSACKRRRLADWQICAVEEEHMACFGDSGSGLVQYDGNRAMLIGAVLGGWKFDKSQLDCSPGVLTYLRVSFFIRFIRDVIEFNITSFPTPAAPKAKPHQMSNKPMETTVHPIGVTIVEMPSDDHNDNEDEEKESNSNNGSDDVFRADKIIALNIFIFLLNILMN